MKVEYVGVEDLFLVLGIKIKQTRSLTPAKQALLLHPEAQIEILAVIFVAQSSDKKLYP
jgi:hypothetical protein